MQEPGNKDIHTNAIRAENEGDRTPEFKAARDNLIHDVRSFLDEVERRQSSGEPLGSHGEIRDEAGIIRTIIQDPFREPKTRQFSDDGIRLDGGVNFMTETTKPRGVYFHHDPETGQRVLVVVNPDKVLEVIDDPLEQQASGPEAGYQGVSSSKLASFTEKLPDGSYVGMEVVSSGQVFLKKFDGAVHAGVALSRSPEQLELVGSMWADIQSQLLSGS
ncbi:hypothetical protein KC951_02090 [Candidatus Saccharibacteria bacterium]|nr:hypothetical protein [Candidatus Saccharibacteria bacterium]